MGGAQGLAITMNQGVGLIVEADRWRVERRLHLQQVDAATAELEEALAWVDEALGQQTPKSIALIGNAAEVLPRLQQYGLVPDVVTDQTAAHDVLHGYIPAGLTVEEASALRARDPERYTQLAMASIARHVETLLAWQARVALSLIMATTCASAPLMQGCRTLLPIRALCQPISVRSSAPGKDRFAGWRSPAIPPISTPPTGP